MQRQGGWSAEGPSAAPMCSAHTQIKLTGHGPGHGGRVVAKVHEPLGNVLSLNAGGVGDRPEVGGAGWGSRSEAGSGLGALRSGAICVRLPVQ